MQRIMWEIAILLAWSHPLSGSDLLEAHFGRPFLSTISGDEFSSILTKRNICLAGEWVTWFFLNKRR